ncbi:MAG: hypothetical protein WCG52_08700 [bacterium]
MHILAGKDHFAMCLWTIVSFIEATQRNWSFHIHDDGSFRGDEHESLVDMNLPLTIHYRRNIEEIIRSKLQMFPLCQQMRDRFSFALKVFDVCLLNPTDRYIMIDCDILFFKKPNEILDWVDSNLMSFYVSKDIAEANLVSCEDAQTLFGIKLWPCVNAGLCFIPCAAMSLADSENFLDKSGLLQMGKVWTIEQTLFSLHASLANSGGYLPATYELSLARDRQPDSISRHYVGAVRDRFYTEGIREIAGRIGI